MDRRFTYEGSISNSFRMDIAVSRHVMYREIIHFREGVYWHKPNLYTQMCLQNAKPTKITSSQSSGVTQRKICPFLQVDLLHYNVWSKTPIIFSLISCNNLTLYLLCRAQIPYVYHHSIGWLEVARSFFKCDVYLK